MNVYNYEQDGFYYNTTVAIPNPKEAGKFLLPANATFTPIPLNAHASDKHEWYWNGITWEDKIPLENQEYPNTEFYTVTVVDGAYAKTPIASLAELKATFIFKEKTEAHRQISLTDWYVIRNAEIGSAIPPEVTAWRAAMRTAKDTRCAEITAATTVEELENLLTSPTSPMTVYPLLSAAYSMGSAY